MRSFASKQQEQIKDYDTQFHVVKDMHNKELFDMNGKHKATLAYLKSQVMRQIYKLTNKFMESLRHVYLMLAYE